MRAVVQRVQRASVDVDGATVSSIGPGLMVLVGIHAEDTPEDARWLAGKVLKARCFEDSHGKMWAENVCAAGGQVIFVSQFTLLGDARKGRRPSFVDAAPAAEAEALVEALAEAARGLGVPVVTGRFQAMMDVYLVNRGPVTILLDTARRF